MDNKIYFPVQDVKFTDLFNWADPLEAKSTTAVKVGRKGLQRQQSQTGSLADVNEAKVALFRHGDIVYAINEKCPHAGGPLHLGDIESLPDRSLCIRCPWHSWRFDLNTGCVRKPSHRSLCATVYPTRILDDGTILVGFDEFDHKYFSDLEF